MSTKQLKILALGSWGTLTPFVGRTVLGGQLKANQYEYLAVLDEYGVLKQNLAKSWRYSDNFRKITFEIDTSKRFSDGSYLTAQDVKNAFEESLRERSAAGQDGMRAYFEIFEQVENGNIHSIRVLNDAHVEFSFRESVRDILTILMVNCDGIIKKTPRGYVGTGPYMLESEKDGKAIYKANPYFSSELEFDSVVVESNADSSKLAALERGEYDVFLGFIEPKPNNNINLAVSHEAYSMNLVFGNHESQSLFEFLEHRKAAQALLTEGLSRDAISSSFNKIGARFDFQFLLPFQKGRLPAAEARRLLLEGASYKQGFVEATKKKPLRVVTRFALDDPRNAFIKILRENGVSFDESSLHPTSVDQTLLASSGKAPFDILLAGMGGVLPQDPDWLRRGHYLTKVYADPELMKLLDKGARITDTMAIEPFYQDVSRYLLTNARFFHLYFTPSYIAYNRSRVSYKFPHSDGSVSFLNFGHR